MPTTPAVDPTDGPNVPHDVPVAALPIAVAGDDPADLVVDPADGVVRARVAVRAADGTVQMFDVHDVHLPDVHPTDPGDVVEVGDVSGTVTFGGDA